MAQSPLFFAGQSPAWQPRVIEIATGDDAEGSIPEDNGSDFVDMNYFRLLGKLQTFLQHDTAEILADYRDKFLDQDVQPLVPEYGHQEEYLVSSRLVQMKHPLLPDSGLDFHPEADFVWFSDEVSSSDLPALRRHYGTQLQSIQNILIEEGTWDSVSEINDILNIMPQARYLCIWLDSYRFLSGARTRTTEEYKQCAAQFQETHQSALKGKHNLLVEYVDSDGHIYGGFRTCRA